MATKAASPATIGPKPPVSHNIVGQKLGRKGRITRDRILAAAEMEIDSGMELSMSSIARRADLGMTSLYNYFNNLTEIVLGLLEPIMAEAEEAYLHILRDRWPDEVLADRAYDFASRFQRFWAQNAAILHLRNAMADGYNSRMMVHRVEATKPVIRALVAQMDADPDGPDTPAIAMASFLMTGLERAVTVNTNDTLAAVVGRFEGAGPERYLRPPARVFELAIRDARAEAEVTAG